MEIIDRYSRQDAIDDGMLVDISDTDEAKGAGFRIPVCLTLAVYELVLVPEALESFQDFPGRLWDTVYMATHALREKKRQGASEDDMRIIPFKVIYSMPDTKEKEEFKQVTFELWLVFCASEGFTIMLPSDY